MKLVDKQSADIRYPAEKLYAFIGDFQNFEKFLPEQVTNWQATETTCSFTIPNLGMVTLRMEREENPLNVKYISTAGPAAFELLFEIERKDETTCQLAISAFVDVPAFMLMMLNKPIKNFLSMLLEKIKTLAEAAPMSS